MESKESFTNTKMDELLVTEHQKIKALKEYKKSVIFEYVTGKKEI